MAKRKRAKKRKTRENKPICGKSTGCKKLTSQSNIETSVAKRARSDSIERYGVGLPTFQEILAYGKEVDKMKESIEFIDALDLQPEPTFDFKMDEHKSTPIPVLDCKHITNEELEMQLERHYQFVYDIFHAISKSERHEKYKHKKYHSMSLSQDSLTYNTSMITFTYEQKEIMLSYLYKKFDNQEFHTQTDYFFKVLLPELCTKIFMDIHNMSKDEAVAYLDRRPVSSSIC